MPALRTIHRVEENSARKPTISTGGNSRNHGIPKQTGQQYKTCYIGQP